MAKRSHLDTVAAAPSLCEYVACSRSGCDVVVTLEQGVDASRVYESGHDDFFCSVDCAYTAFFLRQGPCTAVSAFREALRKYYGRTPQLLCDEQAHADTKTPTSAIVTADEMDYDGS